MKEFALPTPFSARKTSVLSLLTEFMNKRPPAKKPQAKIQTVKKQIPVKKIAPDRIEELVKKHLGNIGEAENAFKSASALLEKHKTKYPELEQYISTFPRLITQSRCLMMSKTQGDLTIYLKSYLLAWSRHIRSHIREKRIIPTWIERPGFPLLKRLWRKRSFISSFYGKRSRLLKR